MMTDDTPAREEGLEPPTCGFGDRCSSQLSYSRIAPWFAEHATSQPERKGKNPESVPKCEDAVARFPPAGQSAGPVPPAYRVSLWVVCLPQCLQNFLYSTRPVCFFLFLVVE